MLTYPQIDPIALQVGPLAIHWYGLTYLAAFGLFMVEATTLLVRQMGVLPEQIYADAFYASGT